MIRSLKKQDRKAVLDLLRATGNFSVADLAIAEELIDIVLSNPSQNDYYAFVAVPESADDSPNGLLVLGPTPGTQGTWHLYWIAVHPSRQGTGSAQALSAHAEAFVSGRGGYWLLVETSSQVNYQRARAYYRKQGYVQVAQIADYYKLSDDMIIYGKRLAHGSAPA